MKKFIKINLIILIIFCLLLINSFSKIYATSDLQNENSEQSEDNSNEESKTNSEESEEKDMDTLQIEKSELENGITESNNQIQLIQSELSNTVFEISEINQTVYEKQIEIQTLEAQEGELLAYIEKAEKELEKSNKRYETQKELLEKRLVAMYEMGDVSYLELLLSSKGIMELFSNYYLIQEISAADTELLENVEAEKKYNKVLKETLETKKLVLIASRETREKNSIALENMALIKNARLKELNEEEAEIQRQIEEYQKEIADIETEIRTLALANISERYVGGTMAWPVPGYTRITSQYGMRTHPITGVYKLHTGVDIGAPYGATFVAANDGVVTYAGMNKAYGNMVIIDHGGGITTLYAHGSKILVQVGDTVFQGASVLEVGSTGYSTGPHAHFEVRVNGSYVQPLDYITSYSNATQNSQSQNNEESKNKNTTKIEVDS